MKKSKIAMILIFTILAIILLSITAKVIAIGSSFYMNFVDQTNTTITNGIMGIYKAIYNSNPKNSASRQNDWLNATSYYLGGISGNDPEWMGEYWVHENEQANMGLDGNKLVNSKYAACVGHRTSTDSGYENGDKRNYKKVRAININTPNSQGIQYKDNERNDFEATNVDALTLGILVTNAVNNTDYKNALVKFWYDNK